MKVHTVRKRAIVVQLSLVSLLALAGCNASASRSAGSGGRGPSATEQSDQSVSQRTLVIATRGELPSLAAKHLVDFSGALDPPLFLFNAMLDYADEQGVSKPMLAEALPTLNTDTWKVFPDGTMETTYHLKPNLTWHDRIPLTADDFVFAWRVYATPQLGAASTPPIGLMEEVSAPDPQTVVIRWREPYPEAAALTDGTTVGFQALPQHILQEPYQTLDSEAFIGLPFWTSEYVGLGPYEVDTIEPGAYVSATAFDGYVFGRPKIDRVELRLIADPQTAVANLLSGEVHFISDFILSVTDGQLLEQQLPDRGGGTVLYSPVSFRAGVVQLRPDVVDTPALLDVQVRRAIASGFDVKSAVEVLASGKSLLTHTLASPRETFYPQIERAIQKHDYDPRVVQQLMEQAGYSKGADGFFVGRDGQTVHFTLASSAGTKNESEAANYVDSLRKSGFDAAQQVVPAAQIRDPQARALLPGVQIRGGGYQYVNYISDQIPRSENRWQGNNRGGWSNGAYDAAFDAYNTTLDRDERIQDMAEMERIVSEDVSVIPLMYNAEANAFVGALQGPVARQTPGTSGTFLHVHEWKWKS